MSCRKEKKIERKWNGNKMENFYKYYREWNEMESGKKKKSLFFGKWKNNGMESGME